MILVDIHDICMTFLLQAAFISHHTIMNKLYEMVEKSSLVSWSDSFDAMKNAFST